MDVAAIRTALATQIDLVPGLRASGVALDNPSPPIALVWPDKGTFLTFDTLTRQPDSLSLIVTVLVAKASDRNGQTQLDGFIAGGALWTSVTDPTLGGLVSFCVFTEARNYGLVEWAGVQYYGVEVIAEIAAP